jgi:hypothetical protein
MGLDTKTYWLTDRQSQCNFNFNFNQLDRREWRVSSEQRNQSKVDAGQKRSRTVKSEVIPEDKSLVNVLYICEVNKCGYNCEYSNK